MLKDYYLEGVKGKIYYFNVRFEIVSGDELVFFGRSIKNLLCL